MFDCQRKLLIVSHSHRLGGAQGILLALVQDLLRHHYECHVVFPRAGPFAEKMAELNDFSKVVKVHFSTLKWWGGYYPNTVYKIVGVLMELPDSVRRLQQIIETEKIDLVLSNTAAMVDGALAARLSGVPHVWYVHELLSQDPKLVSLLRLEFLYPLVLMMSRAVMAASHAVKAEITQWAGPIEDPSKITTITPGIKSPPDIPPVRLKNIILSVGGICRRKGQLNLLRAARIVCEHYPDVVFMNAGSPWEDQYTEDLIQERRELNLEKNFLLLRYQANMDAFYRKGTVLAIPATCEAFGLSALEAMSYGLPVVSTRCGGPEEIVHDQITGFLVDVDSPEQIADRIMLLLDHPELANSMGAMGRTRVEEHFSYSRFLESVHQVIEGALAQ